MSRSDSRRDRMVAVSVDATRYSDTVDYYMRWVMEVGRTHMTGHFTIEMR